MAALATALQTERKDGVIIALPVVAGAKIYKGAPVSIDATSGFAQSNDGTTITLAAGDIFAGECVETVDNLTGASGDVSVRVYTQGLVKWPVSAADAIAQADVGAPMYINNTTDDAEVTKTQDGGADLKVGTLVSVPAANTGYVLITGQFGNIAA